MAFEKCLSRARPSRALSLFPYIETGDPITAVENVAILFVATIVHVRLCKMSLVFRLARSSFGGSIRSSRERGPVYPARLKMNANAATCVACRP